MTIEAAYPRPVHRNFAAVEADLALRRTSAVAGAASAAAVRRAGKLLRVLAQHLSEHRSQPSDRSAQMSCPHLAKPFRDLGKAEGMLLW